MGALEGAIGARLDDIASIGDLTVLRWTAERAAAGVFGYGPGQIQHCIRDDFAVRRLSADRGGSLGEGNPATDPNTSGSTGTASWLAPVTADDLLPLVQQLRTDVDAIEAIPPVEQPFTSVASVTVTHARPVRPSVTVLDAAGRVVVAQIEHVSTTQVLITLNRSSSGTVLVG